MQVKVPTASITLEAEKIDDISFYRYVEPQHMKLIEKLFDKIKNLDSNKFSGEEFIELEALKDHVNDIATNFNGYSKTVYIQKLEEYHGMGTFPENELSLYSRDRELRWGSYEGQFQDDVYSDTFIKETLELLINNL